MTTTREVDELTVRYRLHQRVKQAGGQRAFAREIGIPHNEMNAVYHGARSPSLRICHALGFRRVIRYIEEIES